MRNSLFLFLFFTFSLAATEGETVFHNPAVANLEGDPSTIVNKSVNVITGDLIENDVDLVIPGPTPLKMERSFGISSAELLNRWSSNHTGGLELHRDFAIVEGPFGVCSQMRDEGKFNTTRQYKVHKSCWEKWVTNSASGDISGKTNPINQKLFNNGTSIFFKKGSGEKFFYKKRKKSDYFLDHVLHTNLWKTQYHYSIGTRAVRIESIAPDGEVCGSVDLSLYGKPPTQDLYSSDGRRVRYHYGLGGYGDDFHYISRVERPNAPDVRYSYGANFALLLSKKLPEGRFQENEYYKDGVKSVGGVKIRKVTSDHAVGNRVMLQKAPVGTGPEPVVTHRYFYDLKVKFSSEGKRRLRGGTTTVLDPLFHKTVYHHNQRHRLTKIQKFQGEIPYYTQNYWWGDENTPQAVNLQKFNLVNRWGLELFSRAFSYDRFGNVTVDRMTGRLTGRAGHSDCYIKRSRYSQDRKNNLLEENDGRKTIRYVYHPKTSQPVKKWMEVDGRKLLRTFYAYNPNSVLIEEIIDDGSGDSLQDLTDVTERRIRRIEPLKNGLPHVVKELYLDLQTGEERLLRKAVQSFTREGWMTKQEQYDANDEHLYTLLWEYNRFGNITREVDAIGQETHRRYDGNGNCIYEQGPCADFHIERAYDFSDRLIREEQVLTDGTRYSLEYKYDFAGNKVAAVDVYGNETRYEYDAFGRCKEICEPAIPDEQGALRHPVKRAEFDSFSNPIRVIDPRGGEMKTSYTVRGKPVQKTYPDGSTETFTYTLDGLLESSVDKNGMLSLFQYDAQGRETKKEIYSREGELLSCQETVYNAFHKIAEIDSAGQATQFSYDGAGRVIRIVKGSKETEYEYDSLGRLWKTIEWTSPHEALVKVQEKDYLDRLVEERTEDLQGNLYRQTRYEYDAMGNQTAIWSGDQVSRTQYNFLGDVVSRVDSGGNRTTTHIEYGFVNAFGQKVKRTFTTDPLGNQTIVEFDTHGREAKTLRLSPFGKTTQERDLSYDPCGNLIRTVDHVFQKSKEERLVVNAWEYDICQREIARIEAVGTTEQKVIRTAYSVFGQIASVTKPDGVQLQYEYDGKGRLSSLSSSDGSVHYSYQYDSCDQPLEVYDHVHQTVTRKSFLEGCLVEEELANGLALQYVYDRLDRPIEITYPDGSGVRYRYRGPDIAEIARVIDGSETYIHSYDAYDLSGNLLQSTLIENAGILKYEYDHAGRVRGISHPSWSENEIEYDAAGNLLTRDHCSYSYDDLYQILTESGDFENRYEYDSLYNRTGKNGEESKVNALNQLVEEAFTRYRYDANGNLLNYGEAELAYDALDRLTTVVTPEGEYQYRYDDTHRRTSKIGPDEAVHYLYLGQNEIGSATAEGIRELRMLGHGLGAEIGAAVALELDGKTYAPVHDHIGNLTALVDPSTGSLEAEYRYSAYGEEELTGPAIAWRFSSKRFDAETGLIFFGRRYYAASQGRWITQDPAGFTAGINLYTYVNNNPLTHIDLYGLRSKWLFGVDALGWALQIFGEHLMTVPVVSDACVVTGQLLCGETVNYTATWNRVPAQNKTIKNQGEVSDKVRVTFVNGILNCANSALSIAQYISDAHGGVSVHYTHMETFGGLRDVLRHLGRYSGLFCQPVDKLVENWRERIAEMGGINGGGRIIHYAHSAGGFVTDLALQKLTPEERKMISVVTIGSAKIINMNGLCSLDNYISRYDYVPLLGDTKNYIDARKGKFDHTHFIESDNYIPWRDHMAEETSYKEVFDRSGDRFIENYGSLK